MVFMVFLVPRALSLAHCFGQFWPKSDKMAEMAENQHFHENDPKSVEKWVQKGSNFRPF